MPSIAQHDECFNRIKAFFKSLVIHSQINIYLYGIFYVKILYNEVLFDFYASTLEKNTWSSYDVTKVAQ